MSAQLSSTTSLASGDLFVLYKTSQGDYRGLPVSALMTYLDANLSLNSAGTYTTQYSAPSATGFSIVVTDGGGNNTNVHLILTPLAGYAAGTLVLPAATGLVDKQEVLVNCTQAVTTLTISANGATAVTGAPTTLAANGFFRLKYDKPTSTWYRVG